ncbi:FISUMP domain-containing protein [Riemerella anatipestifer]|nr:FISUMP domain-containing protein [Riemerella anatipestifer]
MKKVLLSAAMLSVLSLQAQTEPAVRQQGAVGINTKEPRATLDVNGNARLQEVQPMAVPASTVERFADCPCVLTIDKYGVVQRIPVNQFATIGGGSGSGSGSGGSYSGGGSGIAVMEGSQTIYVTSIKDGAIDHQGVINNGAQKISFTIPYTSGNNGTYDNVDATVTSNVAAGENSDSNPLQLTINSGTFSSTGGTISGTITVGGDGTLNVKKQALPTSAADFEAKKLEVASIQFNLGTMVYVLKIVGISGVPDRCFGKTTKQCVGYGADVKEHEFIYIPVQGPDGKTWLNNNLGAEYARVGSPVFNPTQQATSKTDHNAYGSLFQWQRNPDGHELINWSGSGSGTPKYNSPTSSLSSSWENPNTNQFIYNGSSYSWVNGSLDSSGPHNLWQSSGAGKTNPCPAGYHVPTHAEQEALLNAIGVGSSNMWNEQVLRLPASGNRYFSNGSFDGQGSNSWLWISEPDSNRSAWNLWFNSSNSGAGSNIYRAYGFSVRCLKD